MIQHVSSGKTPGADAIPAEIYKKIEVSNDQELMQPEPRSFPQNQKRKQPKLQIDITKRTYG